MIAIRNTRSFFRLNKPHTAGRFQRKKKKISMSRNGPHTSTKKMSLWKTSAKTFFRFHNSKREEKSLSSSDFVTAAPVVQQSVGAELENVSEWNSKERTHRTKRHYWFWLGLPRCAGSFILLIRPAMIIAPTH